MSESSLSDANSGLRAKVGRYLGYGSDSANWGNVATVDTQAWVIEQVLLSGTRRFLWPPRINGEPVPHSWAFLRANYPLTTQAPYSTGTVTVTNNSTTVTLASGTWPSWAASGVFTHDGVVYDVATRSSDTVILLAAAFTGDTASGETYSISQRDYDLADDFSFAEGEIHYEAGQGHYGPIPIVGAGLIMRQRQLNGATSGHPALAAVRPKKLTDASSEGQRWEVMFWPTPGAQYTLNFTYSPIPDAISASAIYTYGGGVHAETLLEACLSVAEEREDDNQGIHLTAFMQRLEASVAVDRRMRPQKIGYNRDRSDDLDLHYFCPRHCGLSVPEYLG